jgi:GNAT superfamily N-acetyltransferase
MPPTTTWRVRGAAAEDRAFILRIIPRLSDRFPLPTWRTPREVAEAESAALEAALQQLPEGAVILVAESASGPGGFIYIERHIDYFRRFAHAHVSVLVVADEAEGQGVGRLLLEAAETWAQEQGLAMLTLNVFEGNVRARAVYERLGYMPETLRYVKTL